MTTTTEPTYTKNIVYDRETHDYALYLNDELVGFARSHVEGEETLDALVYDLLNPQPPVPPQVAQMSALLEQYTEAKAQNRLDDAKQLKAEAVALESAHPGVSRLVRESRKAAA